MRKAVLEKCQGNSHSLAMDLFDQWTYMQKTTQWRFTPPTHVVAAFRAALDQFLAEGGTAARGARYAANCAALVDGMTALGFKPFLPRAIQAPVAEEAEAGSYLFELAEERGLVQADLRPLVRGAVEDLSAGVPPGRVSGRFHEGMADVAAAVVRRAAAVHGRLPVVLTGGCFQNARLAEGVFKRLEGDFDVCLHGEVPPGDGGIALGQALVADAVAGS